MFEKEKISVNALTALDILNKALFEAYLVGGCVRDLLLGLIPTDFDITTNAKPEMVLELFKEYSCIPTGLKHGTITVLINNEPIEITTYRIETVYENHRRPKEVCYGEELLEDLKRRDFTINAMAYSPIQGFKDPFNGRKDLKDKVIRCVGDANKRFFEDALRMMRAIRFASKLGFSIDPETFKAIKKNAYLLQYISKERIQDELCKIIVFDGLGLNTLFESGLLEYISQELVECFKCEQNNPYHFTNVGLHTCYALNVFINNVDKKNLSDFDIKTITVSLMLHDIGKPLVKTTIEGIDHFYNHGKYSKKIAIKFLNKLKFSNKEKERILKLIESHDFILNTNMKTLYKFLVKHKIYEDTMKALVIVKYCDMLGKSQEIHENKAIELTNFYQFYLKNLKEGIPYRITDLKIKGNDILRIIPNLEVKPQMIKVILEECLTLCFYNKEKNNYESLCKFVLKNAKRFLK